MTTAADLLDSIKRARTAVAQAEADVREAETVLRDRKKALATARKKAEQAIEEALAERRQPSLFDAAPETSAVPTEPATELKPVGDASAWTDLAPAPVEPSEVPTWRAMTLAATGWDEEWGPETWAAVSGAATAGALADRLLAGETFGLDAHQINNVYGCVEQISQDDESPIRFAGPPASQLTAGAAQNQKTPVTKLADLDNFPDAVADTLLFEGVTTVETLMERVEQELPALGDLPTVNKLVAFFVKLGAKINQAKHAANAVADHVADPAPEPDATRNKPDAAPLKGEPIEGFGLKPGDFSGKWAALNGFNAMKQFDRDAKKPPRVEHLTLNGRPHVVLSVGEHFPGPGTTWEVRPLWPEDVARNRGIAPTPADPLESLTVEIKMGNGSLAGWVKYQIGAKHEQRNLIYAPPKKDPKARKRKAGKS
ncbi:hypothetical protein R5W24_004459 [Gemmata sp. JC717]|uniref:hypothetical protein n=1 Tax=Gemmata algarum TaxID=2975278 RepID=UPI0021BABFE3|nr:hypothetical protein [Gemmata algarum]MDY3555317.1 hypothetical protein [Gemmata algarum]